MPDLDLDAIKLRSSIAYGAAGDGDLGLAQRHDIFLGSAQDIPALLARLTEVEGERDRLRTDADRSWRLLADARTATRRLTSGLIASAHLLDVPFTNEPALSPWSRSIEPAIDQLRVALGMRGGMPLPCCDLHNRNCEVPSELCCEGCTEAAHPGHADGSVCVAPDLSSPPIAESLAAGLRQQDAARDRVVEAAKVWHDLRGLADAAGYHRLCGLVDAAVDALREEPGGGQHPEDTCGRCKGPNYVWVAPSPLWNAVMRGGSISGDEIFDGIVCPTCFAALAQEKGIAELWRLDAERIHANLELVTPSGRVWDVSSWMWRDPADHDEIQADCSTDCRTIDGVTVGLVDAIITAARVLAIRDLTAPAVREALADLRQDEDVAAILATTAGGVVAVRRTRCSTCNGTRSFHCAAHVAGDGCTDMRFECPDCTPSGAAASRGPVDIHKVIKRELWARLDEVMRPVGSRHELDLSPTSLGDWLGDRVYAALLEAGVDGSPLTEKGGDEIPGSSIHSEGGSGRAEVGVHFGCPKCRTILNAQAANCDGPWHHDNQPADPPWLEEAIEAGSAVRYGEPTDDYTWSTVAELAIRAALPLIAAGVLREAADEVVATNPPVGEVAFRVEAWPHDPGANGEEYHSGMLPAADVSHELRRIADRIDQEWAVPECPWPKEHPAARQVTT